MTEERSATPSPAATARRRRWLRRAAAIPVVLALAAGVVILLRPAPVPVDVASSTRGPLEVTIDEDGRARVIDRSTITAPLAGRLARIELHPSDRLEAEQPVAQLWPTAPPLLDERTRASTEERLMSARAQRDAARFAVARARDRATFAAREAERLGVLSRAGATPRRELEAAELALRSGRGEVTSAEFALRVAEHEVRLAEVALGRLSSGSEPLESLVVVSPVAGVVLRVMQESAGPVQAGAALLEVGDPAALEIVADILTSDAVQVPPRAEVRIDRWGGEATLRGHVRLVEPSAFTRVSALGVEEQRVNAIIELDEPRERWAALGDGYRVEVHVVVWRGDDVLRVPASAVFRRRERWCVFVVEAGSAHLRTLELGRRGRDSVEVLSGLAEGAIVIEYPGEQVDDGVLVRAR